MSWKCREFDSQVGILAIIWGFMVGKKILSGETTGLANKNVPLYFPPYFRHLLTDFQNSSTGTLCGQFVIT